MLYIRKSKDNIWLLSSSIPLTISVFVVIIYFYADFSSFAVPLLITTLLIVTLIPIIIGIATYSFDIFEIIYPISIMYFIRYGIRTIYLISHPEDALGFRYTFLDIIDLSLFYAIIGFVFLLIGYYSPVPQLISRFLTRLHLLNFKLDGKNLIKKLYFFYIFSVIARLWALEGGFYRGINTLRETYLPPYTNIVNSIGDLGFYIYTLYFVYLLLPSTKNKRQVLLTWLFLLAIEVGFGLLGGMRGVFLRLIVLPFIVYHYIKQRLSIKHLLIFLLCLMFLISFVIPVMDKYRAFSRFVSPGELVSYKELLNSLKETSSLTTHEESPFKKIINRLTDIDSLSLIVKYTPSIWDFQYGKTFIPLFVGFIPRVLWPGKPKFNLGQRFYIDYLGGNPFSGTSAAVTMVGDFYLNFHVIGIVVGMLLIGIIYKSIYLWLVKNEIKTEYCIFTYAMIFFVFWGIEQDVASIFMHFLRTILSIIVLMLFLKVKLKSLNIKKI